MSIGKKYYIFIDIWLTGDKIIKQSELARINPSAIRIIRRIKDMPLHLADISVISQIEGNFVAAVKETRIGLASEYVKRIIVSW